MPNEDEPLVQLLDQQGYDYLVGNQPLDKREIHTLFLQAVRALREDALKIQGLQNEVSLLKRKLTLSEDQREYSTGSVAQRQRQWT